MWIVLDFRVTEFTVSDLRVSDLTWDWTLLCVGFWSVGFESARSYLRLDSLLDSVGFWSDGFRSVGFESVGS